MEEKRAIFVAGHGSRSAGAVREFEQAVEVIRAASGQETSYGFLEFALPTIESSLESLVARGYRRIDVLPGMLFAAGHVKNDVPSVVNNFAARHPDVSLRLGRTCGFEPALFRLARNRIAAAMARADREAGGGVTGEGGVGAGVSYDQTLLLVIGRGTTDPDANGDISKIARMLTEGMGFGHGEIGFSGVAYPRVTAAAERSVLLARGLGFKRIVIFPYFLFDGILVQRIYREFRAVAATIAGGNDALQCVEASYLGVDPLLAEAFLSVWSGIDTGDIAMNCQLCKYRTQIIGYESATGAAQVGHHHHVSGAGVEEGAVDHGHWHPDQGHHHGDTGHHHGDSHHH
ncbi:MAG: sirohydrochlorin chelatase [Alphaproteobacteria bacterium]|nr:sirohydrochlorin chelatase [Alphaproteobacteria bacterium]